MNASFKLIVASVVLAIGMTALADHTVIVDRTSPFNLCARKLRPSPLIKTPNFRTFNRLSQDEIEQSVHGLLPPFSWGMKSDFATSVNKETLRDIIEILNSAINGSAADQLNVEQSMHFRFGAVFPLLGSNNQRFMYSIIRRSRKLLVRNEVAATDMVKVVADFLALLSNPRVFSNEGFTLRHWSESNSTYGLLQGLLTLDAAVAKGGFPRPHVVFTLRPLDRFELVGQRMAGIIPVRIITTRMHTWNGQTAVTTDYAIAQIAIAARDLARLKAGMKSGDEINVQLRAAYSNLIDLVRSTLSIRDSIERHEKFDALFASARKFLGIQE